MTAGPDKAPEDFPETADVETASDDYAARFSGETGAWFLRVQEQATARMLSGSAGGRVLDVGGGHGQLTPLLIGSGFEVTVTGSAESCKARIRDFVERRQVTFEAANILDLPFEDRSFDIVISYRLLTHVDRWREFLAELTRVADSAVIVDFTAARSVNWIAPRLFGVKKRVEGNTRPFRSFREAELLDAFGQLGFVPSARRAQFFMPMALHRLLKAPRLSAAGEALFRWSGLTRLFGSPVVLKVECEPADAHRR